LIDLDDKITQRSEDDPVN